MGLFGLFEKKETLTPFDVKDDVVVSPVTGKCAEVEKISDPVFAQKMMGETIAFVLSGKKVTLCSPANGTLSVLFPTGHAFGVTMSNGVELLLHCGLDTVNANGGFTILDKKQGDTVKAGEPIIEVDVKKLSAQFDMTTMLILTTNPDGLKFKELSEVTRGQELI